MASRDIKSWYSWWGWWWQWGHPRIFGTYGYYAWHISKLCFDEGLHWLKGAVSNMMQKEFSVGVTSKDLYVNFNGSVQATTMKLITQVAFSIRHITSLCMQLLQWLWKRESACLHPYIGEGLPVNTSSTFCIGTKTHWLSYWSETILLILTVDKVLY